MSRVKITVTLEENLVSQLDTLATKQKTNRSRLVEEVLTSWHKQQQEKELIAGYLEMSQEDKETAEFNLPAAGESLDG